MLAAAAGHALRVFEHPDRQTAKFRAGPKFHEISIFGLVFVFGVFFENVFSTKGWQKNLPKC